MICLVDDDPAARDSLTAVLEMSGFEVVAFASAAAFLAYPHMKRVDGVIVDLHMPEMDGLALLNKLKAQGMRLPVIMITGDGDVAAAVSAMKAGAVDFIEKPYAPAALLSVLRQSLVPPEPRERQDSATREIAARVDALTPRERELLRHLVVGHSNKIAAFELRISPRTVEIHRGNLMKKMHANSLSHLVRMALSAGIDGTS